jgi:hypothetical protein
MKRFVTLATVAASLALAVSASAALVTGVYDPGNTGCVKAMFSKKTLHLEKNCATATNAAAGAEITGVSGATFQSASFTLASASQCQGGSPRFNVVTTTGLFFLGCNNVTPTTNADGTVTYTFTAQTLAADRSAGSDPDRHRPVHERADRRSGHRRPDEDHLQRQAAEGRARTGRLCARLQERRVEDVHEPEVQEPGPVREVRIHGRNAAKRHG